MRVYRGCQGLPPVFVKTLQGFSGTFRLEGGVLELFLLLRTVKDRENPYRVFTRLLAAS